MSNLPRLDIIIPAYNAHHTINRTLASIATQAIVEDIDVTIVNDKSDHDYSEFISWYSKYFNIKEISMPENGGPGIARQFGLDNSSNPLVTFIDADDTFGGAFSLRELRTQLITNPKSCMISGIFCEEQQIPSNGVYMYLPHQQDMVWMFGKMYKRDFLDRHNIRFNMTRANEDNGFNTLIRLCANENEQISFSNDVVYFWHINENSITRINNCEYSYNQSFPGYTDNMIYAIKEAKKRNPFNGYISLFSIEVMCNLYEYYIEAVARDPRFLDQNFEACQRFYNSVYKTIENDINDEIFSQVYNKIMENAYRGQKLQGIIPCMGIREFMADLKEKDKDFKPVPVLEMLPKPIWPGKYNNKNNALYGMKEVVKNEDSSKKEEKSNGTTTTDKK